ncbi:hypothetical protein [Piscinibacter koreensis]|uniref:Uncharacterized protein n=1 Tax=Piscinibacter koreensis TaxID=2742824 RepID=A0A7Y6NQS1_9BURK|nr:hypothetical protein [Schlegelella koreensis]NUZ07615.1 hypothetical protein [Schlegelella koreensis]
MEKTVTAIAWSVYVCLVSLLAAAPHWISVRGWLSTDPAPAWIQAVGSVAAIVATAAVVQWQHVREQRRQIAAELAARVEHCNVTLLKLWRQLNWLVNYQAQFLNPQRAHATRHVSLLSSPPYDYARWMVDGPNLAFLMSTGAAGVVAEIILADEKFEAAVQAVNARSAIHLGEFQPALERLGWAEGWPLEQVERCIGPRLTLQLKAATDQVYLHVDAAIGRLQDVGKVVPAALRQAFPGERFIAFNAPDADRQGPST